jgi:hypothetical protein
MGLDEGQRSKKHGVKGQKIIGLKVNQMFSLSSFRPIRFFQPGSSANQVISVSRSRPIRFRGTGNSANQVLRGWEFTQSDFEELGVQPIR